MTVRSYVAQTADGEVILSPAAGTEFPGRRCRRTGRSPPGTRAGRRRCPRARSRWTEAARARSRPTRRGDRWNSSRPSAAARSSTSASARPTTRRRGRCSARSAAAASMPGRTPAARASTRRSPARSSDRRTASASTGPRRRWSTPWTAPWWRRTRSRSRHRLRPLLSDFATGSGGLSIDWVRMTPYAAAGSFVVARLRRDAGGRLGRTLVDGEHARRLLRPTRRHAVAGRHVDRVCAGRAVRRSHRRPVAIPAIPRRSRDRGSGRHSRGRGRDGGLCARAAQQSAGRGGGRLQRHAGYAADRRGAGRAGE